MKRTYVIGLILVGLLATLPLIAAVSANEGERQITINVNGNVAEVHSHLQNEIDIEFSTGNGIRLHLEYQSETNRTETNLELSVEFLSLVEYGSGNQVLQTLSLTSMTYTNPNATQYVSSDGKSGYRLESHSTTNAPYFQVIAYIFPTNALINGTFLDPQALKITIVIKDFPYQQGNSNLALIVRAQSSREIETTSSASTGETQVETSSTTANGYFSWSNVANVDGVQRPISSTVSKETGQSLITIIYPHGVQIVHDPFLGVGQLATWLVPWLLITIAALLVAVVVVAVIRKSHPRIQNSVRQ